MLWCCSLAFWLHGGASRKEDEQEEWTSNKKLAVCYLASFLYYTHSADSVFFRRNIDRILSLSSSNSSAGGVLSYKEHGLLLSEAHVLRQTLLQVLPVQVSAEFLEDLNELTDLRTGVERQVRVVNRIRWAYAKWLQV